MPEPIPTSERSLRILHVLRAPLGGLFRHVLDLTRAQIARGHQVGMIADSTTGGPTADRVLAELAPDLSLGLARFPMRRNPHVSDLTALFRVARLTASLRPDVVHGHGSKGALFARLPASFSRDDRRTVRVYTPHGGSLHYAPGSRLHALYMRVERALAQKSDLILFESAYIAERYRVSVGEPPCLYRVALNGLAESEFVPVAPEPGAADFVYVGELREAKGIDTLIDALASSAQTTGRRLRAVLVGSGPDQEALQARARRLGLVGQVTFAGVRPARQAFRLGRVLVVPSRAESLPYVVLEAAAAQIPIVATNVGGIPEIFGPYRGRLVPPNDVAALQARMNEELGSTPQDQKAVAAALAEHVHAHFCIDRMADTVLTAYRDALAAKALAPEGQRLSILHPQRYGS